MRTLGVRGLARVPDIPEHPLGSVTEPESLPHVREPSGAMDRSLIVFAVLLALLSASIAYRFGSGNQQEQLPLILRQLDPGYLPGDFFVSTTLEFGPRFYFVHLVAWLSRVLSLPWVYAALTFLSDLALIAVTLWAARQIVGAGRAGASIAAILTVAVTSFHLGDATELRYEVFQPASLAIPGMLLAVGLGWQGRPVPAAISAVLASLPHPLYGVQAGAIAMCTAFIALLIRRADSQKEGRFTLSQLAWRRAVVQTAMGTGILGAATLLFWWWPMQSTQAAPLSTNELFDIIARFRSPHHYLPTQFRPQDWVTTALFCFALLIAFEQWSRAAPPRRRLVFLIPTLLVVVGCVAGTLFTEVWPLRAVLTLQPFRLLSIVKWTGYLLLGWLFATYWTTAPSGVTRPIVAMSLFSPAGTFPVVTAAGLSLIRFQTWIPRRLDARWFVAALTAGAVALWLTFGSVDERTRLTAATALLVVLSHSSRAVRTAGIVATLALVVAIARNRPDAPAAHSPLRPIFSLGDMQDVDARMARTIATYTPSNAMLIVPPNFGVLRFVGQRALVVDFKAIPLVDGPMREWRERIRQVYGDVEGGGVVASRRLEDAYRGVTDAHLQELASRFGATHAVLFAETPTGLPQLVVDHPYRLVSLRTAN